jgi:spore maturation protein CgeB
MRIAYFTHSLRSCWNHGNAHFLRGVLTELIALGHAVEAFEPEGAWSVRNLLADHGQKALDRFAADYPELSSTVYRADADPAELVDKADLVIVHEWNEPHLVAALGRMRARGADFTLLFHDAHHRAVSAPEQMRAYDLDGYDGVLAFGETLAEVYRGWGWRDRVFVWHEAADIRRFHPPLEERERHGLVWIGNWGDNERSEELLEFLLQPAQWANIPLDIYGVRYPAEAKDMLWRYGARYHGWVANAAAPELFARHMATIHVPRRFYREALPGIPTIRVFEALACGIPLVSTPWDDSEGLFRVGEDFLMVEKGEDMIAALTQLKNEPELRESLARSGLETIRARHTCAHRARELMRIVAEIGSHRAKPRHERPSTSLGTNGDRDVRLETAA